MRSTNIKIQIRAIHNVSIIAQALGTERTRIELIPYLHELLDDNDQTSVGICDALGSLLD